MGIYRLSNGVVRVFGVRGEGEGQELGNREGMSNM
jgi:hypothetical protein